MQCCVLQGSELSELSDSVGFPHTFSHNQPGQSRAAGQCQQRRPAGPAETSQTPVRLCYIVNTDCHTLSHTLSHTPHTTHISVSTLPT